MELEPPENTWRFADMMVYLPALAANDFLMLWARRTAENLPSGTGLHQSCHGTNRLGKGTVSWRWHGMVRGSGVVFPCFPMFFPCYEWEDDVAWPLLGVWSCHVFGKGSSNGASLLNKYPHQLARVFSSLADLQPGCWYLPGTGGTACLIRSIFRWCQGLTLGPPTILRKAKHIRCHLQEVMNWRRKSWRRPGKPRTLGERAMTWP